MSRSVLPNGDLDTLKYIVTHVFFPLQLPDGDDHNISNDHALAGAIASAAHIYSDRLGEAEVSQWHNIPRMLDDLHAIVRLEGLDVSRTISQLRSMDIGDVRAFLIRAQNVAIVCRKQSSGTIFESFELSPKTEDVMASQGKLICSYPGPAIEIPTAVFDNEGFLAELANFLAHMNDDILDAAPTSHKAQSTLLETRDTTDPRYITELLTGILRSVGSPANVARISKRIGDDVVWDNSELPWRRSSLWLLIRVALQTSLDRYELGHHTYKTFMLSFMCYLAKEESCADLPNDLLQAILAKISRRLRKLGSFAPDWLSHTVLQTCTSLRSTLEKRWKQIQDAQLVSPLWAPSQLDLSGDIRLSLPNSGDYIRNSLATQSVPSIPVHFDPQHDRRGALDDFLSSDGAFFDKAYRAEPHVALYDVECAVRHGIEAWIGQVINNDEACVQLEILAHKYSSSALQTYGSNPELLSVMLLTTLELWVALDKIVIREIPMLAEYSPEVPMRLLEDLLACKRGDLHRLCCVYQYLSHRYSSSTRGWSVFSLAFTANSFAVRFYESSSHLQHLKARIEEAARGEVRQKVMELKGANDRHAELQRMVAQTSHDYYVNRYGNERHSSWCTKCSYESQLQSMEIMVHEWPLPAQRLEAEVVVFELDCPVSFNMWRIATFHLLVDLCSPSRERNHPYIELSQYSALQPYFVQHPRSRITLGSDAKPVVNTHYKMVRSFPTTQEKVCVNNGLSFYSFDNYGCVPVSLALGHEDIGKYCTYQLGSELYQNLQNYVNATTHTSNEVMANQADCHMDLSIHEFIAFGHLRSGNLLQWLNILRELRGRSLSFHRYEVHFLIAQAVSQVGPFADAEWTWHQEIQQPSFCFALLEELEALIRNVEGNWLEVVTMDTTSFLLRRLLASSPDPAVSQKALELLRTTRHKVFFWIQELSDKLVEAPGDEELRTFLRDAAVICRSTSDVDPAMITELLLTEEDIKILLCSATLIQRHTPANVSSLPAYSQLLLDRNRRLSLVLEQVLSDVIQVDWGARGVDLAVGLVWPGYRPGSRWTTLQSPNSRWLSCMTEATATKISQTVHFNLLDGLLLVSGKPLGRLPNDIQQHPLYDVIFSGQVLDVIPADLPGMDYSTRGLVFNHQVHFSLRGKNLVIRANVSGSSEIIELIPAEKLEGDLPTVMIEGHAHWLNLSTSVMEIRPLGTLWKSSQENWIIDCNTGRYRAHRGHELLVDMRSKSWDMVASLLRPLDEPKNLLIAVCPVDSDQSSSLVQLFVVLHRYKLSFYVDGDGDLQSHDIRGMVYDRNQTIGSLFGLVNWLVLRPKNSRNEVDVDKLDYRCVLIPEGDVSFRTNGHHVRIEIDTRGSAIQQVKYQAYRIDTDLGCLSGNASLTSKLFCVYLHALTSGCGNDPLTGRSGTDEALSLLRSAGCWSFIRLESRNAELLRLIASICPSRTWYPSHLQRMQTVAWLDLPVNSQHHDLYLVSKAIKEHYERVQLFHEGESKPLLQDFPQRNEHLLERSARRAAYLYPSDLSGQPSRASLDVWYSARDVVNGSSGESRAYAAASIVYHRRASSTTNMGIVLNMLKSWITVKSGDATLSLRYHRSWLTPNTPLIWLQVYDLVRRRDERKWFQLLFSLPAMAYASPNHVDLVPAFIAFAIDPQFYSEDPPPYDAYELSKEYQPPANTLRSYVSDSAYSFESSPESSEPARSGESDQNWKRRQYDMYTNRRNIDINATVELFLNAWPCDTPPRCSLNARLYDVTQVMSHVQSLFAMCYRNLQLKEHLTRVQMVLNSLYSQTVPNPYSVYAFDPSRDVPPCVLWSFTTNQLFMRPAPFLPERSILPRFTTEVGDASFAGAKPLYGLISTAKKNMGNSFQLQYLSALRASADCLRSEIPSTAQTTTEPPTIETLQAHYTRCSASYIEGLQRLQRYLCPRSQSGQALEQSGQWPCITAHALFRCLASNAPVELSDDWKQCLTRLTLLMLDVQRARRLLRLRLGDLRDELCKELENEGCNGWSPEAHPDWLLVQLQANFLVRRVQAEVASEMIAPLSGSNTAMQLNMGEGKSSVIVPIVVANLADGDQLVRVIVPKALTVQMFDLLVGRLGGLVNRRIYFVPFSRSLQIDRQKAVALREIMSECMQERGILVVQPEHVLSLRLMSVEKQLLEEGDDQLARLLLEFQRWLHCRSRDILDESDEILHVRYQLVYTIGLQQQMEGSPGRWTTTEQVLSLVSKHASSLRKRFPLGVEYECGPSRSFPHLRILHKDAGEQLISWIVRDVLDGMLPNFNPAQLHSDLRGTIENFISCVHILPADFQLIRERAEQSHLWSRLLLLRGLLATGILLFAFQGRRWRVNYGLAPERTMLAVPYRAKDVPAQRAEFGHPDVAIILTCLSYYYGGLSEDQLRLSFEILFKQDDPTLDYELWVQGCTDVPECLRTVSGVNTKSLEQWNTLLFPLFSRNKATVDFYLSNIVFPKEAKEFPSKLACSGWDLAEKKERILTGFSGTNDGQYLLPLHITQRDPDHQKGTNAKVLSYILQPENNHYMCLTHESGERRTTHEFLKILVAQEPEIRVLLDVGAQMLDLQNHELAGAWLDIKRNASAAIYFNEKDELVVRSRDGSTQPFISSPFSQQLDQCVIYLDDVHTRGTDIKFPSGFRAAVTLGPKVTKDRLTQGCMRMRKLGHRHTIMFFAPLEVDQRIRTVAGKGKDPKKVINTTDILHWTLRETCEEIQQRTPHWAHQGTDHTARYRAWISFCADQLSSEALSNEWLQPEAKKLEHLYGLHNASGPGWLAEPDIYRRCIELGVPSHHDVSMDEEQEREVLHEAEQERQVERPPKVPAASHSIHPDVIAFINTGIVPTNTSAFRPVFETLDATSAMTNEAHIWSPLVLATTDFQRTICSSGKLDEYLRPVQWVISVQKDHDETLAALSPYEANYLIPHIRSSNRVYLHLYTPRVARSMKPCDGLDLYNIPGVPVGWTPPSSLVDQLNVFAGQLYLKDYETYTRLCRFLCVRTKDLKGIEAEVDGFIPPRFRPARMWTPEDTFQSSPLGSLSELTNLRRKGMRFAPTDMGKLLDGCLLSEEDFDEGEDDEVVPFIFFSVVLIVLWLVALIVLRLVALIVLRLVAPLVFVVLIALWLIAPW